MIFTIQPDGKTYPARDMLEAFEDMMRGMRTKERFNFTKRLSYRISNNLQV
jgi:hypothetical protein